MTREDVLEAIRAHLADELELDPARVTEATHFKQDLEADSLDLYTLVQELEDTYGVVMTDEQAARIQTVGAAVDFVLEHVERPDAGRSHQDVGPDAPRGVPSDPTGPRP
jgi:acyl carrier protein